MPGKIIIPNGRSAGFYSTQLNSQLDPVRETVRRRRRGLAGLSFDEWNVPGSQFSSQWNGIQNQLQLEGQKLGINPSVTATAVSVAQSKMLDAVNQLSDSFDAAGVQSDASALISAAGQYVKTGETIVGAGQTIIGLVRQAQGIQTGQQAAAFMGSAIGAILAASVATGILSAGIGAAIGAMVAAFVTLAEALAPTQNLQGQSPCQAFPGFLCQNPDYTIGCTCVYGISVLGAGSVGTSPGAAVTLPSSPLWRHFPNPTQDPQWFNFETPQSFRWKDLSIGTPVGYITSGVSAAGSSNYLYRPIDMAFAAFHQMELDATNPLPGASFIPSAVSQFNMAWQVAWRANQEFALNGLKVQDDYLILKHAIDLWNKAHAPGQPFTFKQAPFGITPAWSPIVYLVGNGNAGASSGVQTSSITLADGKVGMLADVGANARQYSYIQILGQQIVQHGGSLTLNTGPAYDVPDVTGGQTVPKAAASTAAAVAGVAALGVLAYSQVAGLTVGAALKELLGAIKSPFVK